MTARNKSVSGDEVTTLSLFAAAAGGWSGKGVGRARSSAKLSEDIKK